MPHLRWQHNNLPKKNKEQSIAFLCEKEVKKARDFHAGFPLYEETPLVCLPHLADLLGLGHIFVKDESFRFGLNAFKVLGATYAMGSYIAQKLGKDVAEVDFKTLASAKIKKELGELTFFTATDGNHGRGVAWAAAQLGQKSVVYMPSGSSQTRLENILKHGAKASITDLNYDDAVRLAVKNASKLPGSVVIQDTAFENYTAIPTRIMQGYGTMVLEAAEQLVQMGTEKPSHIFIQAGVGSLAGAVQGYFASVFTKFRPKVVVVEAGKADCLYQSAKAGDGNPRITTGKMQTIMAGLACGEPNILGWEILKNYAHGFISCDDPIAALGMRILGNPLQGDDRVVSGESGAVTTGALYEIMTNPDYRELKNSLGLDESSKVLMFSTEGDTDPDVYKSICWQGKYSIGAVQEF